MCPSFPRCCPFIPLGQTCFKDALHLSLDSGLPRVCRVVLVGSCSTAQAEVRHPTINNANVTILSGQILPSSLGKYHLAWQMWHAYDCYSGCKRLGFFPKCSVKTRLGPRYLFTFILEQQLWLSLPPTSMKAHKLLPSWREGVCALPC